MLPDETMLLRGKRSATRHRFFARKALSLGLRSFPDCNFSGMCVARDLGKPTQTFASSTLRVSKRVRFGPGPHENTLEIRVGWLSKIADSEAFREKQNYPEGVRVRRLLTTVRQGFRPILRGVHVAIFRLG